MCVQFYVHLTNANSDNGREYVIVPTFEKSTRSKITPVRCWSNHNKQYISVRHSENKISSFPPIKCVFVVFI